MRALQSCDFCGSEAVGTFEVVPAELEPSEDEQRRVVLCPDCRDRLETLLEPLLARVDGSVDGQNAGGDANETVAATTDGRTNRHKGPQRPATGGSEDDESDTGVTITTREITETTDTDADETSLESVDSSEPTAPSSADETGDDGRSDDATDEQTTSRAAAGRRETGTDATEAARSPRAYSKVVRLLRNREFPMERTAVEELAAGAYDLESHEAEAIVDHAIDDGELVEERGVLERP